MATTAFSRRAAAISFSSSSIGADRSASVDRIQSPLAASIPLRTAYPLPRFPGLRRSRHEFSPCGLRPARPCRRGSRRRPPEFPPTGIGDSPHNARMRSSVAGRRCCSLYAGMTMESVSKSTARTLFKIPPVCGFQSLAQWNASLPAQRREPRHIQQFTRRAIRL